MIEEMSIFSIKLFFSDNGVQEMLTFHGFNIDHKLWFDRAEDGEWLLKFAVQYRFSIFIRIIQFVKIVYKKRDHQKSKNQK